MLQNTNLHTLTHGVINDLQKALPSCLNRPTAGLILSAIVTVKMVHDELLDIDCTSSNIDPEEYCSAI